MSKQFNTRIQNKSGRYSDWEQAINFKPLLGEIIIYIPNDENDTRPIAIKVGDGETLVNDLEFAGAGSIIGETGVLQLQSDWAQEDSTAINYIKNKPEIIDEVLKDNDALVSSKGIYEAVKNHTVAWFNYWEDGE